MFLTNTLTPVYFLLGCTFVALATLLVILPACTFLATVQL